MIDFTGKKFGNITIEKPLHKGGYGYSYIGYDESLEKDRVVKVSKHPVDSVEAEGHELEDFINEGLILSRLNHTQIVNIIEHGELYGHRYMILNFIEGHTLHSLLDTLNKIKYDYGCNWDQVLDPLTALALAISCLEPLAYAHDTRIKLPNQVVKNGIAHRDISASNLILGTGSEYEGKMHLIDFGAAKTGVNVSATINTKIIGSPQYLSPMRLLKPQNEKDKQKPYWKTFRQTQHDVHAMGCLFFELLTGRSFIPSFSDVPSCLAAIVNPKTYEGLHQKIRVYDRSIQDLIKKSIVMPDIEKNKGGDQYPSASEMQQAFEKVFYRLSGFAEVKNVLVDFSRRVENKENFKPIPVNNPTTVAKYTKTGRVKSGKRSQSQGSIKWIYALMFVMLSVTVYLTLDLVNEKQVLPDKTPETERVGGPAVETEDSQPPVAADAVNQAQKEVIKKPAARPRIQKKVSASPAAVIQNSPPKAREVKQAAPGVKDVISPELLAKRQNVLYEQIKRHIKEKNYQRASLLNNSLIEETGDPGLYLLKAEIIRGRTGKALDVKKIINRARGKSSRFMSENEMWVKIKILDN